MNELPHLKRFAYIDKFKLSFDNVLMFTGEFLDKPNNNLFGKNLYIPASEKHPALTLKITRVPWPGPTNTSAVGIQFDSTEERQLVANYDFDGDIFYIDL